MEDSPRCLFVGDGCVGKSSMIKTEVAGTFETNADGVKALGVKFTIVPPEGALILEDTYGQIEFERQR